MARGVVVRGWLVATALAASACTAVRGDPTVASPPSGAGPAADAGTTAPTTAAPVTGPAPPATTAAPATTTGPAPPATTTTTTAAPRVRAVADTGWAPFATVGGLTLTHPSARVERVAFHEANHDGARSLDPLPTAAAPTTLEGRDRGTSPRSAADVVVDPGMEIRSPVTGLVKRGGTYTLYCEHRDDFVVIAPDANPAWEVKLLHIDGLVVRRGQRVVAGETVLAARATQLPFESQVDEVRTADPAWPHVHIEVVDPSIPDRPNPGGSNCN